MVKIATLATGLALIMSQPVMAAPLASGSPAASDSATAGQGPAPAKTHGRAFQAPGSIEVSLMALAAAVLGIVAATRHYGHDHHPTSP